MPLFAAASLNNRFTQLTAGAIFLLVVSWVVLTTFDFPTPIRIPSITKPKPPPTYVVPDGSHAIDHLIHEADVESYRLSGKVTHSLHDAAAAYRERRGRQPPPNFDVWYEFARNKSGVIVEDFFDQIYDDLNPFWGLPAKQIRESAHVFKHVISVRNGSADHKSDQPRDWMILWSNLTSSISMHLPDVDVPINVMDESRLVVPWEDIDGYMAKERESRRIVPTAELKTEFQSLKELDESQITDFDPKWEGEGSYWDKAKVGCHPDSPGRAKPAETDWTEPPPLQTTWPAGSYRGYVKNWTLARQPCEYANIQGLHGTFVEPISMSNSKRLFPLFGGSKLPMNNEILLPAAMYWTDDPFYSGGKGHGGQWEDKTDGIVWRGSASGGRNKLTNWARFQRHRFLSMINGTSVKLAEKDNFPPNFALPQRGQYNLSSFQTAGQYLGDWVDNWSDAAFVHLLCFPESKIKKHCEYTDPYYEVKSTIPMDKQYSYKYLPDIDGNSFSGRYRGFMRSTSLPIKATIYNEWHDSRMVAWKHFVPIDNTFVDIYGIMEYFHGNKNTGVMGHDDHARAIALAGKAWAETVLRKEDMQIYVFRLLLEYARVCDDEREIMGWAESDVT